MTSRLVLALVFILGAASHATAEQATQLDARMRTARAVFEELMLLPDGEIPDQLVSDARCIAVIPGVIKGAFIWGGRFGRGVVSCKSESGRWSPPVFESLGGGSFGLQIGLSSTDLVLFFMSERGARSLLESKFTLGADAAVAAGPAGRSAHAGTDIRLRAEIYSYARSKGLFLGVSLEGARLAPQVEWTTEYYGAYNPPADILFGGAQRSLPKSAREFLAVLPRG